MILDVWQLGWLSCYERIKFTLWPRFFFTVNFWIRFQNWTKGISNWIPKQKNGLEGVTAVLKNLGAFYPLKVLISSRYNYSYHTTWKHILLDEAARLTNNRLNCSFDSAIPNWTSVLFAFAAGEVWIKPLKFIELKNDGNGKKSYVIF